MIAFLLALSWLCISTSLLLTLARRSRAYEVLGSDNVVDATEAPFLTVIIPARNESATIGRCLTGLLTQTYPSQRLNVLVVDDNSTDNTAEIVLRIAQSDRRIRLMEAGSLPEGWIGKQHACWQAAMVAQGEWLCFLDADTVPAPHLINAAVSLAQAKEIDLLSLQPFLEIGTFWERVINPTALFVLALAMDVRRINDPTMPDAAANGNFILIRRRVYEAIRGHASVRAEMQEDVALARIVKRSGYRLYLMHGQDLIRTRTYTSLRDIWEGSSKNTVDAMRDMPSMVLAFIEALLLAWMPVMLPLCLWTWINLTSRPTVPNGLAVGLALLGSIANLTAIMMVMRFFRMPIRYGLLLPFGLTMGVAIILTSVWQRVMGHTKWKGREYSFLRGSSQQMNDDIAGRTR